MQSELLTTDELSARIKYDVRTIRERLKDSVLLEGVHYIRLFGGRKILFVWDRIAEDMAKTSAASLDAIPMADGVSSMGSVRQLVGRGTLFLDFRYSGQRFREYTALPDTPTNRTRLE